MARAKNAEIIEIRLCVVSDFFIYRNKYIYTHRTHISTRAVHSTPQNRFDP